MENTHTMIRRNVRLDLQHSVYFTREAFSTGNETLAKILRPNREGRRSKVILHVDEGLLDGNPNPPKRLNQYFPAPDEAINLRHAPS